MEQRGPERGALPPQGVPSCQQNRKPFWLPKCTHRRAFWKDKFSALLTEFAEAVSGPQIKQPQGSEHEPLFTCL